MELLKRKRASIRTGFTKALNSFNGLMEREEALEEEYTATFQIVELKMNELDALQVELNDLLFSADDISNEVIEKDSEECDDYRRKFYVAKNKLNQRSGAASSINTVRTNRTESREGTKRTYKLPKIELVKFDGDIMNWLQFWSMFKKIHEDTDIDKEDKFQYLIQAMVPGSRAAELVKSYPPTSANYSKVIEGLKNRFGRDDDLVEVYVRELLQLVLENAHKTGKEVKLASLYDKLETHLRALESLGMTNDKCAAVLYPLVQSALPEEILRAWHRSNPKPKAQVGGFFEQCGERLTKLIEFIETEVQSESKTSRAVQGFCLDKSRTESSQKKKNKVSNEKSAEATAASLLNSKADSCIFCGQKDHGSVNCEKAKSMKLSERQELAKKNNACFNCLKIGHAFKKCKVKVHCSKCSRRHVDLMCFEKKERGENVQAATVAVNIPQVCNLASSSKYSCVFMETLRVKMISHTNEITVRVVIDTGSQRSYVTREA